MAQQLSTQGAEALYNLRQEIQQAYGLHDIGQIAEGFAVDPTRQQRLEQAITESDSFLKSISSHGVEELSGEKVGMGVSGFIGKRTDTNAGHDRKALDPTSLTARDYFCHESEYDLLIKWAKIDKWAKFRRQFYAMWQRLVVKQQALNRIQVGFWGQYEAIETANAGYSATPDKYPMGQDFHMGWLQYIIHWAPEKVWGLNPDGTISTIQVGPGGDFVNLDELITAVKMELLVRQYRKHPDQRALIGEDLYNAEILRFWRSAGDTATEKPAVEAYIEKHKFGQTKALDVPFFPERGVLITPLENISHYTQIGSMRRSIENNKHRKGVEDFTFRNEDFVIEDLDQVCMIHPDAIQVPDGKGGWKALAPADKWAIEIPA